MTSSTHGNTPTELRYPLKESRESTVSDEHGFDEPQITVIQGSTDSFKQLQTTSVVYDNRTERPIITPPPATHVTFSSSPTTGDGSQPNPGLLSPVSPVDDESASLQSPPSPTLSYLSRSSSFNSPPTTLQLRSNVPNVSDGQSSPQLLIPVHVHHRRRGSSATVASSSFAFESTAGHSYRSDNPRSEAVSTLTSATQTQIGLSENYSASSSQITRGHNGLNLSNSVIGASLGGNDHELQHMDTDQRGPQSSEHVDHAEDNDIDPAPFSVKPIQLARLVDPKSIEALEKLGGVNGLIHALHSHRTYGLGAMTASNSASENARVPEYPMTPLSAEATPIDVNAATASVTIEDRKRVFGENVLPPRRSKSLLLLMWLALKDRVLILLSAAAIVSLALGFFQDFGPARDRAQPPIDWVEGMAIIAAIFIVVFVGSLNDWQKERQFKVLNAKKEKRFVKVIRVGREQLIDVHEVVVGDIALLEPGEIIPCDGVFLSGHNVRCDESGVTGESEAIKKISYEDYIARRDSMRFMYSPKKSSISASSMLEVDGAERIDPFNHVDCFVISGSKVLEGVGSFIVTSVGERSFNGRIMRALCEDIEATPLQLDLNALANSIAMAGAVASCMLFLGLLVRFFIEIGTNAPPMSSSEKGLAFINILIISITLIVVAVPEGLPLAVTLTLAFATKRMSSENLLVRVLASCETMANASVVCTDKTGTLTQNEMSVVAGSVGIHAKFVRGLKRHQDRATISSTSTDIGTRTHAQDFSLDLSDLDTVLSPALCRLFNESIAINSTAFEDKDPVTGDPIFVGSKTETALLKMAKELNWDNYKMIRDITHTLQLLPFSSRRKTMGNIVRLPNGRARLYVKGASEILTKECLRHVVVHNGTDPFTTSNAAADEVETVALNELDRDNIARTITFYTSHTLRTIALCYRDFESWPPPDVQLNEDDEVPYASLVRNMTLIGIIGIEDPLRPGVREAVASCIRAGVQVRMCTGDNVLTARSISRQCGIYTPGGIIMEGPRFSALSEDSRRQIVPRLQVLARSSPEEKRLLVETLKELGEIVGVTGDGTNDGPALKMANVGFSMGLAGTEVAKEASDIILMDDNFASIVKAIMWGRAVNDAVRKFLQFQITTSISAALITLVSCLVSANSKGALGAVQLLWINMIMDTFAALALATDTASPTSLDRKPHKKRAPLFTVDMLKQITVQCIYQTIIILLFHFRGGHILGSPSNATDDKRVSTFVFNAFVFAQIFNMFNCRRIDNKLNIFDGLRSNPYFMFITLFEVCAQVAIVSVGGSVFNVTRITAREWGISIVLGFASVPLGALTRFIPNGFCERIFKKIRLLRDHPILPISNADRAAPELNFPYSTNHNNLDTFRRVRGGRLNASPYASMRYTHRWEARAAVMSPTLHPALVDAQMMSTNWKPPKATLLASPTAMERSRSSDALIENRFEVHPGTSPDDPVHAVLSQVTF